VLARDTLITSSGNVGHYNTFSSIPSTAVYCCHIFLLCQSVSTSTSNIYNNIASGSLCKYGSVSPGQSRHSSSDLKHNFSSFSLPCILFCYVKIYDPCEINATPYCFIVSTISFEYPFHFTVIFIVTFLFSKYLYRNFVSTFLLLKERQCLI
jgi:hypothetical protein